MFMLEIEGDRWGVTFCRTSKYLPYVQVLDLVRIATLMYLNQEDEREVENHDSYRGRIYTRKEYDTIESCGGIVFYAELETIKGKDTMKFLVSERTPNRRLSFSTN